jgi:hypothetical protein
MPEIDDLKKQYLDYDSEFLLEMRARGELLVPEAHHAIEDILRERNERIPPLPSKPIILKREDLIAAPPKRADSRPGRVLKGLFVIAMLAFAIVLGAILAHTALGIVGAVVFGVYFLARAMRREAMSAADRAVEDEGLTEIMVCAANGDLTRIEELVNYGAEVNVESSKGDTPLMLAARNNHANVVRYLLTAGASPNTVSHSAHQTASDLLAGRDTTARTAIDMARSLGHSEVVKVFEEHMAQAASEASPSHAFQHTR